MKLICANCSYRFESGLEGKKKCPYCGGAKVKPEQDVTSLLDEVNEDE